MTTVRALIATTVKKGWCISQLDVNNAFLHGDLNEEVYMQVPPGLVVDKPTLVYKLNKSLYGLKHTRYTHSMNDYSLFYKKDGNTSVYVAVCVDDVLLTRSDQEEIIQLKDFLNEQFRIKDLGQLHYFLRLEVMYKDVGVIISQRKFVLDMLKEYNFLDYKPCSSPLDPTIKLKAKESTILQDPTYDRKLVGKLNFLTNTRLDIAYSVQHLSQFMQDPREPHLKAAFHMLRYLRNDPTLGIFMSKDADCIVKAYCDFDWAAYPDSRRSITGYLVLLSNNPISWKSKKQETISLSSTEAEYRALRKVVGELVWLSRLFEDLIVPYPMPISVLCDSQSALHIAKNPVFHERTKHIEVDYHFVRDQLQAGLVSLHHIRTDSQLADILTKALTGIKHSATLGKMFIALSLYLLLRPFSEFSWRES
ncbi:PREDICTED: uncharacterized protein LOC109230001 [Nicotiana attenuata]|uniref:uncharacterized protein LOC109230001 n=1 Tax=Nicotiana attenuata TaxID=49451 RepID=UPI000905C968|nr:PREDICTED: uncharacterized protein LOC109230001 [Nicotiana attenuata]